MSFFGKNIKKIRSVKGLSQQSFADIFDLKRGTLGAYEEGRSEPKIETIIKIANYFSILIDDLLKSELTVNQLLKFKDNVVTDKKPIKKLLQKEIICVGKSNFKEYIQESKSSLKANFPLIHLPLDKEEEHLAYIVSDLEMTSNESGFYPDDIVVGKKTSFDEIKNNDNSTLVFLIANDQILFRRVYCIDDKFLLKADHRSVEDAEINSSDFKEIWEVACVFFKRVPEFSSEIENKIFLLEKSLSALIEGKFKP